MWTGLHADTDLNIFAGALYRAHPVMASEGNRLTSYLQTFGQRAEQHQMGQSPQSSRHRERLLSARQRSEKAGIPVRSHPYSKPTPCVANNPRTARLFTRSICHHISLSFSCTATQHRIFTVLFRNAVFQHKSFAGGKKKKKKDAEDARP